MRLPLNSAPGPGRFFGGIWGWVVLLRESLDLLIGMLVLLVGMPSTT